MQAAGGFFGDFGGEDAVVTGIEDAFAVSDEKDLRRFVMHVEPFGNSLRNRAMGNEVEVVGVHAVGKVTTVEAGFGHIADGATGAVFEEQYRFVFAIANYLV